DRATIQFRMLNRSKGPTVWAPRAQCDRTLYRRAVRALLEQFPALELTQGMVTNLLVDQRGTRITGVETGDGRRFSARAVIITATLIDEQICDNALRELEGRELLEQGAHGA